MLLLAVNCLSTETPLLQGLSCAAKGRKAAAEHRCWDLKVAQEERAKKFEEHKRLCFDFFCTPEALLAPPLRVLRPVRFFVG